MEEKKGVEDSEWEFSRSVRSKEFIKLLFTLLFSSIQKTYNRF